MRLRWLDGRERVKGSEYSACLIGADPCPKICLELNLLLSGQPAAAREWDSNDSGGTPFGEWIDA